jgi:zeaxanthin glucosyltransferase
MKIGFLSFPASGHLNPMLALARKLQSRGNEIVFIGVPDVEPLVSAAKLTFAPICEKEYPVGSIAASWAPVSKMRGIEAARYSFGELSPDLTSAALKHLPKKLAELGIDALVIDTVYWFVQLVPMYLDIPYVHIWNVLPLDVSGFTPALFFSWPHLDTAEARARNLEGLGKVGEIVTPNAIAAMPYAKEVGLDINWSDPTATTSKLAVISQIPREFDYPNIPWPANFHYAGPFHDGEGRTPIDFPWEKLTGEPLIYAALGTVMNGLEDVYKAILGAVGPLTGFQLVLSIGKNIDPADLGPIPTNTILVREAPQIELLKIAVLCITHAGLNTVLEALAQGVPMVAIPNSYDQPGVAARIAYHGIGEFIELDSLTVERLSELIQKVLKNLSYLEKARYFQEVIAKARGLDAAADVIEEAFEIHHTNAIATLVEA